MYRFEPGTYKIPEGFLPAIACYMKFKNGSEVLDYVLVNVNVILKTENHAVEKSTESLNNAFKKRQSTGGLRQVTQTPSTAVPLGLIPPAILDE